MAGMAAIGIGARCLGGEPFVRKQVNSAPGAATPDVELFDARGGYRELRYLNFTARMLRDEHARNRALRWFRLQLADWYGFALPHIDLAYDKTTHELREYSGVSNIRAAKGRNLSVTIRFPRSERRDDVTPAEIERGTGQPLTGRCVLQ